MSGQIQVMAWLRIDDNPLFKPMVTQIYGATRPYWIKKTLTKININRLRNNAGWCTTGYFLIYIIILTCIFALFCFVSFHWIAMLRKNPITITMGLWTHVFPSLKWKHFDEIFVIGHTGSCHGENFSGLVLQEYLDIGTKKTRGSWRRHQMETFSALLAIFAGNWPVTGEFPPQRPVTRSFDVFFDLHLNERLIE